MPEVTHDSIYFSGHVQGVGFRYSTLQVAQEFEVTGFVRNLADGRVQLEVEGKPDVIDEFVTALQDRMHGYIRKLERSREARASQFKGFSIR